MFCPAPRQNPLPFELAIDRVVSTAGLAGTVYATFGRAFATPVVVPILGSKNSGMFGNVLTQGAVASLEIIPEGKLDLIRMNMFVQYDGGPDRVCGVLFSEAAIKGKFGIPLEIDGLKQTAVPTS
ncbi:hypothetical protein DXG01_000958 [Tephrocybe rancida]|nr:hypothetical protein DXG01_000958 [Tephrocybe rancida]